MKHELSEIYPDAPVQKVLDALKEKLGKKFRVALDGNRLTLSWEERQRKMACRYCARWGNNPKICTRCIGLLDGPSEFTPLKKDKRMSVSMVLLDVEDGK